MTDTADEFSPEAIRYWHGGRCPRCRWTMLESATEGGVSSGASGAGRGERLGLAHFKADLEQAADGLPAHWQSTALIYRKQHRESALKQRRQGTPVVPDVFREPEHPVPSQALENALLWMSRSLGWQEPWLIDVA